MIENKKYLKVPQSVGVQISDPVLKLAVLLIMVYTPVHFTTIPCPLILKKQPWISTLCLNCFRETPQAHFFILLICKMIRVDLFCLWATFVFLITYFLQKLYQKWENPTTVKLPYVLFCCKFRGLLHIYLLRKVDSTQTWNSQNCF